MAVDPQAPNGKNEEGMLLTVVSVCNNIMFFAVFIGHFFTSSFLPFKLSTWVYLLPKLRGTTLTQDRAIAEKETVSLRDTQ